MSDLIVPVLEIKEVLPHPNADKLELVVVAGWQVVVGKGDFKVGDPVVHVPPDSIVPEDLGRKLGVWDYTSNGRVKHIKLRKEPSFGFVVPLKAVADELKPWGPAAVVTGCNVAKYLGVTKYEPPVRSASNNAVRGGKTSIEIAGFPTYTNIQNLRHYPDAIPVGESVWITEKIHGTNSRIGMVNGLKVAGSHRMRRYNPTAKLRELLLDWWIVVCDAPRDRKWKMIKRAYRGIINHLRTPHNLICSANSNTYWYPWSIKGMDALFDELSQTYSTIVVYGEIFGPGIQSMDYGVPEGKLGYVVFDIKVDGEYMRFSTAMLLCKKHGIPTVPVDTATPYSFAAIKPFSEKPSKLTDKHIREGVVVRPLNEATNPRHGRVIYKYVGDPYLFAQKTDYTEC